MEHPLGRATSRDWGGPVPPTFLCPITQQLLEDPVTTEDGQIYERSAIEEWFRRGHRTSPLTGLLLHSLELKSENPLRRAMEDYARHRPELLQRSTSGGSARQAARLLEAEVAHCTEVFAKQGLRRTIEKLRRALHEPEARLRCDATEVIQELESLLWATGTAAAVQAPAYKKPVAGDTTEDAAEEATEEATEGIGVEHGPQEALLSGICLATLDGHSDWVSSVAALGPDRLASASADHTIKVWELIGFSGHSCQATLTGHAGPVCSVVALESGRLASCSADGTIGLWDVDNHSLLSQLRNEGGGVMYTITELSAGRLLSGSDDRTVGIWDCEAGRCTMRLEGHGAAVFSAAVLGPERAISGSGDRSLKVWDLRSGECTTTLAGHGDNVWSIAVLGEERVASASADHSIRIWDLRACQYSMVSGGHTGAVYGLASLGSNHLASASRDRTIKIWEIGSQWCPSTATLSGHSNTVFCVTALRGERLASGSGEGTVKLWQLGCHQP